MYTLCLSYMMHFRDEKLTDFKGLRIDSNGEINIPEPSSTTESIALYVKRHFALEHERSKLVQITTLLKYYNWGVMVYSNFGS